jgi:ferredoxin
MRPGASINKGANRGVSHFEVMTARLRIETPSGVERWDGPAPVGERVLDLCDEAGSPISLSCRSGTCGTCRVAVIEGASLVAPPTLLELQTLREQNAAPNERLACQLVVTGSSGTLGFRLLQALACLVIALTVSCASQPAVGSINAVLGKDSESGKLFVRETPMADAPGLHLIPGDEIIMVDGHHVRDMDTQRLRTLLRGEPGTEVNLTVARGGEVLRMKVRRTTLRAALLPKKEERIEE